MSRGGKNPAVVCAIVAFLFSILVAVCPTGAAITGIGDINPMYDGLDPWIVSGDLVVGPTVDANLVIVGGSRVESYRGFVGRSSNVFVVPVVMVTGSGSLWQNAGDLVVGDVGRGWLRIQDGGQVTDANAYVGWQAGGNGLVQVTGAGSTWDSSGELHVGATGDGTLYIEEGGSVTSRTGVLGTETTGVGVVAVTGTNSVWENVWDSGSQLGGDLYVGHSGIGDLGIGAGGQVISHTASVGHTATGDGEVNVSGAGSLWENTTTLQIGAAGAGRLTITEGGTVTTQDAIAAAEAGSTALVTIADEDSLWRTLNILKIGGAGDANVVVSNGAHIEGTASFLATEADGTAQVTITGAGSRLMSFHFTVGEFGLGDVFVEDGGNVATGHTTLGTWTGSVGSAFVTGPDSLWSNASLLDVGYYGYGRLVVSEGGRVTSANANIGAMSGGEGEVVLIGQDSVWTNASALYIGGSSMGAGGTGRLVLQDNATVQSDSIQIWSTGTIVGEGTMEADVVNHGTIRPGNSIGTLAIDGDLSAIEDTSVIEFEIDNEGNCDKLLVSGFFTFRRQALVPVPLETLVGTHDYAVVEANGVEERIQSMEWPYPVVEPGLIRSTIAYGDDPNSVLLRVTALPFDDPNVARTCNHAALGSALDQIAAAGGNDLTMTLQQLDTSDAVRAAYGQLSGQTVPSLAPVSVAGASRHVGMVAGRLHDGTAGVSNGAGFGEAATSLVSRSDAVGIDTGQYLFALGNGTAAFGDQPWGVWGKGYGLYGDRESESGFPGYQYTVYGTSFGLDYRFTNRLLVGLTGGYSEGDIDAAGSRDGSDVSATHGGLYAGYETSRWYLDSILTYADLDYETRRYVDLVAERLDGETAGDLFTGYIEAGLSYWRSGPTLLQPLAAFQFSTLDIDGFTETGGDSALTFDDERYESYKGSLGVKLTRRLFEHADGCRADLSLRGRWVHEFGDTRATMDAAFADAPGATFRVSDAEVSRDSAVLGAGLDTWFGRQTRVFLDYGTELNTDNTAHLLTAGLEHRW